MTRLLRFLLVTMLMAAVLTGAAHTAYADPTPCTFGCDGGNAPKP